MRTILHSDLNNFFASVEESKNPELKGKPIIVVGSKEDRHGIVLAKNTLAKSYGIKTAETIWQAKKKCPNVIEVKSSYGDYTRTSKMVREIYERFTDKIEPYGIDECWLDVTDTQKLFGGGEKIAETIRETVKKELGLTVSVGVSFNKVFAKLASDMKKPDAVTIIGKEDFKEKIWKLPVEDLLYVGRATKNKLNSRGIITIGDLAKTPESTLTKWLGKWGGYLYSYANGLDESPVIPIDQTEDVKSIGNSMTHYKDLNSVDEVRMLILALAESVSSRLRGSGLGKATTVKLGIIDSNLKRYGKQCKTTYPTASGLEFAKACYKMFDELYDWKCPVRGVGVTVCDFTHGVSQMTMFEEVKDEDRQDRLGNAVEGIRKKYGNGMVFRASIMQDERLSANDIVNKTSEHKSPVDKG